MHDACQRRGRGVIGTDGGPTWGVGRPMISGQSLMETCPGVARQRKRQKKSKQAGKENGLCVPP